MSVKRFHAEIGTAIGTGAVGLIAVLGAMQLGYGWEESGPQSGYFPFYVGLILIAASIWNLIAAYLKHNAVSARTQASIEAEAPFLDGERLGRLARFTGTMLGFVILTLTMGIYVGSTCYIAFVAWRQGGYRLPVAIGIALAFSIALYLIFEVAFLMPLLKGPIEPLLGIY